MGNNWFNLSAGVILFITGAAKIVSASGRATILQWLDPIFGIQYNHLMYVAGILELFVACISFFCRSKVLGSVATTWLATCLLIYRVGLWWIGWKRPCHCLGDFTDALHIPPQAADSAMKIILAYLLIGGYGIMLHQWWKGMVLAAGGSEKGSAKLKLGTGS